ncbi:hypothetical protein EVAR_26783_1 [Eumeta japonica]|uniref:Uncharacterized protein n=1 Tax=Eumeta variegata TaxID=151549 RepID=A0A4C1XEM0_EUMVA|nr:hypothetical protein EVAR_26783_1 [Eumeta japonica]
MLDYLTQAQSETKRVRQVHAADVQRIFVLESGPFVQFTDWDLVFLLEVQQRQGRDPQTLDVSRLSVHSEQRQLSHGYNKVNRHPVNTLEISISFRFQLRAILGYLQLTVARDLHRVVDSRKRKRPSHVEPETFSSWWPLENFSSSAVIRSTRNIDSISDAVLTPSGRCRGRAAPHSVNPITESALSAVKTIKT